MSQQALRQKQLSRSRSRTLQQQVERRKEKRKVETAKRQAEQKAQKLQSEVNKTISQINEGTIKTISDIPESQRQYLDMSQIKTYIDKRKTYQAQAQRQGQYSHAFRVLTNQIKGNLSGIPKDIIKKVREQIRANPSLSSAQDISSLGLSKSQLQDIEYLSGQGISYQVEQPITTKTTQPETLSGVTSQSLVSNDYATYKNIFTGDYISAPKGTSKCFRKTNVWS